MGRCIIATALTAALFAADAASPAAQTRQPRSTFRLSTEIVLVNVVVRDRTGRVVQGLTKDDFVVLEDAKPQTIANFEFEKLDVAAEPAAPAPAAPATPVLATPKPGAPPVEPAKQDLHDRRLIVLFFDLSSMQPEEAARAAASARDYVEHGLTPSDLVAVATFSTSLQVPQDFTADRERLGQALGRIDGTGGQGFEEGLTGDPEGRPDTGDAFTPDETEFNIFSTDRRLEALRTVADALAGIEQKKSLIYFSSGMNQSGLDNRVQIRAVVDRAVRANVSIYAADMRGLPPIVPGGDASSASVHGVSAFNGRSTSNAFDRSTATQDTLATLAEDTGGRAFFDTNQFAGVFDRVVADTSAYYILGYSSTNPARDGKFRRIKVQLKDKADYRLEFRAGYYAPRDFAHASREDREQQLADQLQSDLSATDLNVYASAGYFRLAENRFYVPVSFVVPGSEVPFARASDKDKATLDVLGIVLDERRRPIGRIRETIRLAVQGAQEVRRKNVQYETGFELPPGRYKLKVVVRENQDGTMGSFETDLAIPDLKSDRVKVSSVVLGTQLQSGVRRDDRNPLARGGAALVPNVAHVVSRTQHLYFYYEVYDPAKGPSGVKLLTNLSFFRNSVRVYETPLVEAHELTAPDRRSAVFQLDVPAASLQPGFYTCQVNVIDDVAGAFLFPRLALFVR